MKLRTKTLRPGMRLYHGTSSDFDEKSEAIITPAWFTEKPRTARWFVSWHGEPEAMPYGKKLGLLARIIEFRVNSPLRLVLIPDKETMAEITDEYLGGSFDTETLSDWVCNSGYDGWFVPNNYPDEMAADIMLCSTDALQYVNTARVEESSIYNMAQQINEITGEGGEWFNRPHRLRRAGKARMNWEPGMEDPTAPKVNPRFSLPQPAEKPQLNYMSSSDLDSLLDQIAAENAQPPHKKNTAKIFALKQAAQEIARRLESRWVQQSADRLVPRLDESQAGV